jgi:hypothetical protein
MEGSVREMRRDKSELVLVNFVWEHLNLLSSVAAEE